MGVVRGPLALVAADGAVPVSPGAALLEELAPPNNHGLLARSVRISPAPPSTSPLSGMMALAPRCSADGLGSAMVRPSGTWGAGST